MSEDRFIEVRFYVDRAGKYRWTCVSGNNEVLARSPGGYDSIEKRAEDIQYIVSREHDAEIYVDNAGEWRWRFRRDGRILAISSEGYANRGDCKYASDLLLDGIPVDD